MELSQLAAPLTGSQEGDPPAEAQSLFPVLRQAQAMAPLVIVLAFLPPLYAAAHRTLSEEGARQGLLSLECLAADRLTGFLDPVPTDLPRELAFQPLLMNWLTALSMRVFGVGHGYAHVAPAYLCTAGLIVAAYVLARRFGGDKLGLLSAALLAGNPHVLRLAQEPAPQSAGVMFALLALAGMTAHWQKSTAQASWQLLFGGIALGLCLLAGGAAALAVVSILLIYAACWKFDAWRRPADETVLDRTLTSRRRAVRSVLILAATGFAVGGWRSLWMGSRYGAAFWGPWLGLTVASAEDPGGAESGLGGWGLLLRGGSLVLPVAVLALVGIVGVIREIVRHSEDPGLRHRGLLLVWTLLSAVLWISRQPPAQESLHGALWEVLLICPLTILAADGLLAIIERRTSFRAAVAVFLATCCILFLHALRRDDHALSDGAATIWMMLTWLAAAGTTLLLALQTGASVERRRRSVLAGIVLGLFCVTGLWGARGVRRDTAVDRELTELRNGLARLPDVERGVLVSLSTAGVADARLPTELRYTLRSLWPEAEWTRLASWDEAARLLVPPTGGALPRTLIVTWSPRGRPRQPAPPGVVKAASSFIFQDHELTPFVPGEKTP